MDTIGPTQSRRAIDTLATTALGAWSVACIGPFGPPTAVSPGFGTRVSRLTVTGSHRRVEPSTLRTPEVRFCCTPVFRFRVFLKFAHIIRCRYEPRGSPSESVARSPVDFATQRNHRCVVAAPSRTQTPGSPPERPPDESRWRRSKSRAGEAESGIILVPKSSASP